MSRKLLTRENAEKIIHITEPIEYDIAIFDKEGKEILDKIVNKIKDLGKYIFVDIYGKVVEKPVFDLSEEMPIDSDDYNTVFAVITKDDDPYDYPDIPDNHGISIISRTAIEITQEKISNDLRPEVQYSNEFEKEIKDIVLSMKKEYPHWNFVKV